MSSPNDLIEGFELGILNEVETAEYNELTSTLSEGNELGILNESESILFDSISGIKSDVSDMPISQKRKIRDSLEAEQTNFFPATDPETTPFDFKEAGEKIIESEFPIGAAVGGTAGAVGGFALGKTPIAATIGAGIGAAGGELIEQQIRRGFGLEGVPETPAEAISEVGKEGLIGFAGEGVPRIAIGSGQKLLRMLTKRITPDQMKATKFLEQEIGIKPGLTAAEATEFRPFDVIENIIDSSFVGGNRIFDFKRNRNIALTKFGTAFGDDIGSRLSSEDVGQLVIDYLKGTRKIGKDAGGILINTVGENTKNIKIRTPVTKKVKTGLFDSRGKEIIRPVTEFEEHDIVNIKRAIDILKNNPIIDDVKNIAIAKNLSGVNILNGIITQGAKTPFMSVKEAQGLRSLFLAIKDEVKLVSKNARAIAVANDLDTILKGQITKALKNHAPDQLPLWNEGRRLIFQAHKPLQTKVIERLIRSSDPQFGGQPGKLVSKLFSRDNARQLQELKNVIDKDTFAQLKGFYIRDIMAKSIDVDTGFIVGNKLKNGFFGKTGIGNKALNIIFDPKELSTLRRFANATQKSQAKQGDGIGKIFIQLKQAGAIVQLASAAVSAQQGNPVQAGIIVIAPALMARAMTNPRFVKLLLSGDISNKKQLMAGMLGRIAAEATFSDMTLLKPEELKANNQ